MKALLAYHAKSPLERARSRVLNHGISIDIMLILYSMIFLTLDLEVVGIPIPISPVCCSLDQIRAN